MKTFNDFEGEAKGGIFFRSFDFKFEKLERFL